LAGAAAGGLVVRFAASVAPQPADALPAYAQQTGLACGRCHVKPAGGGKRTASLPRFGGAFSLRLELIGFGAHGRAATNAAAFFLSR